MLELEGQPLTLDLIAHVAQGHASVRLSEAARAKMAASRAVVEQKVAEHAPTYGVNTGFGKLADVRIPDADLRTLQRNLVRSHACGVGEPLPPPVVRAMMLLRANVLAKGLTGARPEVADLLLAMLEADVLPTVPSRGSVGASGDLAPLAHLAMGLMGEGTVLLNEVRLPAAAALAEVGLAPIELEAKEGLALLNGTQAMAAVAALALVDAERLAHLADVAGAMTLEAVLGTPAAFDPRLHEARPQRGQREVAAHLRSLLEGSEIRESHRDGDARVQDAYSLRCMPQVHGAVRSALLHARETTELETGSATDNPIVFPDAGDVVSGGNFHGAPLALAYDFAKIAMVDLMSIAERRIDRLVNPDLSDGLPPFLCAQPGLSSGFMIPHVVAVALLNEARGLATPASIDNAPTSAGKEDHVSMGMTAALQLRSIVDLASRVVAIELLAAAEGLEYRRPLRSGSGVEAAYAFVRERVPRLHEDRSLSEEIEDLATALLSEPMGV